MKYRVKGGNSGTQVIPAPLINQINRITINRLTINASV